MSRQHPIDDQVRLPLSIAFEVVLQGIRIRLGRSLVTIMGVVLGIAFLMSILSSDAIKQGVSEEEELRQEIERMGNFLAAEIGPPTDRSYAVLAVGPVNEAELRLLQSLHDGGADEIRFAGNSSQAETFTATRFMQQVERTELTRDAHVLLIVGEGTAERVDWLEYAGGLRNKIAAKTRLPALETAGGLRPVVLERNLHAEEIARRQAEAGRALFRRRWIIAISMLVTIICISNSMLMSVTERFREIGTMKCLGALSAFIRTMFLIESSLMGVVGSAVGCLAGWLVSVLIYGSSYGVGLVLSSLALTSILAHIGICLAAGMVLSIVAAIYPANIASKMVPANALRSNI